MKRHAMDLYNLKTFRSEERTSKDTDSTNQSFLMHDQGYFTSLSSMPPVEDSSEENEENSESLSFLHEPQTACCATPSISMNRLRRLGNDLVRFKNCSKGLKEALFGNLYERQLQERKEQEMDVQEMDVQERDVQEMDVQEIDVQERKIEERKVQERKEQERKEQERKEQEIDVQERKIQERKVQERKEQKRIVQETKQKQKKTIQVKPVNVANNPLEPMKPKVAIGHSEFLLRKKSVKPVKLGKITPACDSNDNKNTLICELIEPATPHKQDRNSDFPAPGNLKNGQEILYRKADGHSCITRTIPGCKQRGQ